jgi:hypothetical protein
MAFRAPKIDAAGSQIGGGQFIPVVRRPFESRVTEPSRFTRGDSPMYESEKKKAVSPFGRRSE